MGSEGELRDSFQGAMRGNSATKPKSRDEEDSMLIILSNFLSKVPDCSLLKLLDVDFSSA